MIGPLQASILERASQSSAGNVMPADARERKALRRLERREIVTPVPGLPDVWRTEK